MNLKRLIGSVAVAGVVGASTLGIGGGIANASPAQTSSGSAAVQPVDWHGGGHRHGYGYGYGHDYRGGWPGFRWYPWGGPWRW